VADQASRYASLRREFDRISRGLRDRRGQYRVSDARWREVVTWLFHQFIDVLMSGASRFWSRLTPEEQGTLRSFAKDLGLRPQTVLRGADPKKRGEIVRILRKAFGLRPEGGRTATGAAASAPRN
jgi:hypothetical protein